MTTLGKGEHAESLLQEKYLQITTVEPNCIFLENKEDEEAAVVLDFGKEIHGSLRILTFGNVGRRYGEVNITLGESVAEAMSNVYEKNATNDHAPRDFEFVTSGMSDLKFGQTGFRFVRLELIEGEEVAVQNIYAVSYLPFFEREAEIKTNDELLNEIIKTAAYTLKLNFQNGYIWDGIKRDRRVKRINELVIDGYVYADVEMLMETAHALTAQMDGHVFQAGFDGVAHSYIRVDGVQVARKLRLY